jgi:hypothetical protein
MVGVTGSIPVVPTTQPDVLASCGDCRERPAIGGVFRPRSDGSESLFAEVWRFRRLVSGPKISVPGAISDCSFSWKYRSLWRFRRPLSPAAKIPFPVGKRASASALGLARYRLCMDGVALMRCGRCALAAYCAIACIDTSTPTRGLTPALIEPGAPSRRQ